MLWLVICLSLTIVFLIDMPDRIIKLYCFFVPYFIIVVFPVLYLHLDYYSRNGGVKFIISESGIVKKNYEKEIVYHINDFETIEFVMTAGRISAIARGGLPFVNYYYAKIRLKTSEEIIITSLYSQGVEDALIFNFKDKNVPIIYSKCFYPNVS